MSISGDLELAIEERAAVVRVRQTIFGARALPNSFHQPS